MPVRQRIENGITPFAMNVGDNQHFGERDELVRGALRITPLPARITGAFASEITFAACAILRSGATDVYAVCTTMGSASTCICAMFSGKSMNAPPGFSVCATLNALRTISGTIDASRICVAYLEIGWNRFTRCSI